MDRERIYSAFFDTISAAGTFKTKSRKLLSWDDVDKVKQPAIYQKQAGEQAQRTKGLPTIWTLQVHLIIFCQSPDDTSPATAALNPILDSVTGMIETKKNPAAGGPRLPLLPGETNTLDIPGVSHCWIEGEIDIFEGTLGRQAVAIIPVNIKVA